jgi:hypothetical protein
MKRSPTPPESKTPRTDELLDYASRAERHPSGLDSWGLCRRLEVELADAQALITRLEDEILYGPEGNV